MKFFDYGCCHFMSATSPCVSSSTTASTHSQADARTLGLVSKRTPCALVSFWPFNLPFFYSHKPTNRPRFLAFSLLAMQLQRFPHTHGLCGLVDHSYSTPSSVALSL
ncbi:unnamed protein product [Protopolystoma xenopodis]|uniref:Uncharacterized protein n=1 Tax=Protopolystoma xenopodis TaxID=117903 RepID=A0A448XCH8_9PLAT|nr:unnamed protein product [Protopolystoma xenopodis]